MTLLVALVSGALGLPGVALAVPHSAGEVPASQTYAASRTFSETGFTVANYFYKTWKATPNALFVYGLPISQPFIEESISSPGEFYRVQYFERAILEEHPDNFGTPYYILGRLLGSKLASTRGDETAFKAVANPGDGTFDSASGHTLRNGPAPFRTFYAKNGGLTVFGRPLSEQFQEVNKANGKTYWVQYFERQRMEWHPEETNPNYQILLGLLGNEYRDANHAGSPAFVAGASLPNELSGAGNGGGSTSSGNSGGNTSSGNGSTSSASTGFVYGFNALLYEQQISTPVPGMRMKTLQLAKDAGMPWIRIQVRWMDLHDRSGAIYWGELDNIVSDANNQGVKLLASIVNAPSWATSNGLNGLPSREHFNDFNFFVGSMAARYKGRVQAYEIWNEENLAHENAGRVANASFYLDMLVGASNAIRANDPSALVLSGAPSATETNVSSIAISDITFLDQMFSDPRFNSSVDIVGVHPGGASNPPDTMWPSNPGPGPNYVTSGEFYFRRVETVRDLMVRKGLSNKPVWVTEFGWATRNNTPGYGFGNSISYQMQADYIVRAFQLAKTNYSPWLTGMFLWQLNYAVSWKANNNEFHEQASYGVVNGDYSPRPAYLALQAMPK
jgi:hypothetical protein